MKYKDAYNEEVYKKYSDISNEEKESIINYLLATKRAVVILEKNSKTHTYYCSVCNKVHTVSNERWREIRKSKICAFCGYEISVKKSRDWHFNRLINISRDRYNCGYFCKVRYQDGEINFSYFLAKLRCYDVWRFVVKGISISNAMSYSRVIENVDVKNWKFACGQTYIYDSIDYRDVEQFSQRIKSLKFHYKQYKGNLKSNQVYLVRQHVLNYKQLMYMEFFDLNRVEPLYKYIKYIEENSNPISYKNWKFNEYCLEYLVKNNIRLSDYMDYRGDLETLKLDYKYPKNFHKKHVEYADLVAVMNNQDVADRIVEVCSKLQSLKYSDKKYTIAPFETFGELRVEGREQSICIAGYAKKYANQETFLFKIRSNEDLDKPLAALEYRNGRVIQCRTKRNEQPDNSVLRFVDKWKKHLVEVGLCTA